MLEIGRSSYDFKNVKGIKNGARTDLQSSLEALAKFLDMETLQIWQWEDEIEKMDIFYLVNFVLISQITKIPLMHNFEISPYHVHFCSS